VLAKVRVTPSPSLTRADALHRQMETDYEALCEKFPEQSDGEMELTEG